MYTEIKSTINKKFLYILFGVITEYLEMSLYGLFLHQMIPAFFGSSGVYSLSLGFVVFALGFVARPLGGVFFGHIADTYSRTLSLILSMSIMTMSTFLISVLPSYQSIGFKATACFIFFRILQGFSVSGEYSTALTIACERPNHKLPILSSAFVLGASYCGGFLASYLSIIFSTSFRHAYFVSSVFSLLVLIFRLKQHCSIPLIPIKMKHQKFHKKSDESAIRKKSFLFTVFYNIFILFMFYSIMIFYGHYYKKLFDLNDFYFQIYNSLLFLVWTFISILGGFYYQKNQGYLFHLPKISLCLIIPSVYLAYFLVFLFDCYFASFVGQILISIPVILAALPIGMINLKLFYFSKRRATSIGLLYNTSAALAGGASPLICNFIKELRGEFIDVALFITIYVIFLGFIYKWYSNYIQYNRNFI